MGVDCLIFLNKIFIRRGPSCHQLKRGAESMKNIKGEKGRIIVISNRLPVKITKSHGEIRFKPSVGGLATGLKTMDTVEDILWLGWSGLKREKLSEAEHKSIDHKLRKKGYHTVSLSAEQVNRYYLGFCNRSIWPLFHYFTEYAEYSEKMWRAYIDVNRMFLKELESIYREGDIIWVQDYHLMLLPKMIRKRFGNAKIGYFLHIPFPSFEVFRLFPWRREILEGLMGSDLIGFHTYDYVSHFLNSARRVLGLEHDLGLIRYGYRYTKVDFFPMGIDYDKYHNSREKPEVKREMTKIRRITKNRKVILSMDRLDYSKGIPKRLKAFERFLEKYPRFREKVTLILVAVPSRKGVKKYGELKRELDELVGCINGRFGTIGWSPVWYISRFIPSNRLFALYNVSDVDLITPIRDGMNLIAKESVASKYGGSGLLVLSEMAGSAQELGEAVIVNPNNREDMADAIFKALTLDKEEKGRRVEKMQKRLKRYDIDKWGNDFLHRLNEVVNREIEASHKNLMDGHKEKLIDDFRKSKSRLIMLDYDGTLSHFRNRPDEANPDDEIHSIIGRLSSEDNNKVILISGRKKDNLDDWFGHHRIGLCAEHGVWIRDLDEEWTTIKPMNDHWKEPMRELLNIYTDRTPGSWVEEKDFSLVWHYRRADPDLAEIRSKELVGDLMEMVSNLDLGVLEGNKVIEIKKLGVNKGEVANRYIYSQKWDFIMAIGDDWTDEDMFQVMPESAYSIKVGSAPSKAKYNIADVDEVRKLLRDLTR